MRMLLGMLVLAEVVMLLHAPRPAVPLSPAPAVVAVASPSPTPVASPSPTPARGRLTYMQILQREVERVRDLRFKQDVVQETRTRKQTHAILKQELDKEDLAPEEVTLKALGLIGPDVNLHDLILGLYTSQVAGFYDPKTRRFYMVKAPASLLSPLSGAIDSLTGTTEINIIHELDHALTDQHFDLERYMHPKRNGKPVANDDEELARQCVVEGDATMVMIHAQRKQMGLDFEFMRIEGGELEHMTDMLSWLPGLGQEELYAAPLMLRRRLVFPYFYGAGFMDYLRQEGDGPDQAYLSAPRSTAQILHPRLYVEHEEPLDIPKSIIPPELDGWRMRNSNVFGEFRLNVLFEQALGVKPDPASQWRGDRFWIYQKAHQYGVVWASTWSPEKARVAAEAFSLRLTRRYGIRSGPDIQRLFSSNRVPAKAKWSRVVDGRVYGVEVDGTNVRVEEGVPPALSARWKTVRLQWRDVGPAR